MKKLYLIFHLLYLSTFFIQQTKSNVIAYTYVDCNFPRKLYVQPNLDNKILNITCSEPNNKVKLFYQNKNTGKENQCTSDSNNKSNLICSFLDYGTYNFYYSYENQGKIQLKNIVQIFSSLDKVFTITKSRETNCLYKKEPFTYTLDPKDGVNVDFSEIQVYAFSRYSPIRNITSNTTIKLKNESNVYIIDKELNLSKFEIVITENDDIFDSLGTFQNITVTDLIPDEYFYPSLNKIRFFKVDCDLKMDYLILNDSITINCNETSKKFPDSSIYFCFYEQNNLNFKILKLNFTLLI